MFVDEGREDTQRVVSVNKFERMRLIAAAKDKREFKERVAHKRKHAAVVAACKQLKTLILLIGEFYECKIL